MDDSNQYSVGERIIAKLLSRFPKLKQYCKLNYQKLNYLFYKGEENCISGYKIIPVIDGGPEVFFGYYDKSPLNDTNEFLIFQESSRATCKLPSGQFPVFVVLYDFVHHRELGRWSSKTYNWQQGTKLQWISSNHFIFNDINSEGKYCAQVVNALTKSIEKTISFPIYDVYLDHAFSLNFDRLDLLRPDYGYRNHRFTRCNLQNIVSDGIFKIDLINGRSFLFLTLKEIIDFESQSRMLLPGVTHKVNHIMISPFGDKIIFLHRYFIEGRKYDRLILLDVEGKTMKLLSDHDMVSHCCWADNNTIIAFLRRFHTGDKYYKINVSTGEVNVFGEKVIDKYGDGHPNVYKGKLIFDTYPNKARMKTLFLYDEEKGLKELGKFYESFAYYGETRCDLHPKFSYDGKRVFFDSVHTGKRMLYYIEL